MKGDEMRPILATLAFLGVLLAALFLFQPYSADWPGSGYTQPARRFIHAALRQDSLALTRLSASDSPVRWALAAARRHRDTLDLWSRRADAWTGERRGDTTEVIVYPPGRDCREAPIVFRFVGSGSAMKVLQASSDCLNSG